MATLRITPSRDFTDAQMDELKSALSTMSPGVQVIIGLGNENLGPVGVWPEGTMLDLGRRPNPVIPMDIQVAEDTVLQAQRNEVSRAILLDALRRKRGGY